MGQQIEQTSLPGYEVKHFTDENGLPQNSVRSIISDAHGYIWLATERGLARFDGNRFVNYDNLGNSFAARSIYGFNLDPQSRKGSVLAMTSNQVWIRIVDGKAAIDSTLRGYPLHRSANVSKARDLHLIESLPDLNEAAVTHYRHGIAAVYPLSAGRHFVYDEQNIGYYVNNKMEQLHPFPGRSFFRFFRLGENLYYLDEKLKPTRFAGTGGNSRPEETILTGPLLADANYNLTGQYQIFWNNCSNQTFISTGSRLYELRPSKDGSLVSTLILEGFDFRGKDIKTVFLQSETGRLFFGSQLNGLYILSKKPFRTLVAPSAQSDNVYYGQALIEHNKIATLTGTAFSLDSRSFGAITPLTLIKKHVQWDKYNIIRDRAGTLWSKRRETLFRFTGDGKRILSSWKVPDEIKQLYQGPNGRIWIGTNSLGLYYLDPDKIGAQPHFFAGRHLSNISWMQQQGNEIMWIGTGKGLYKIHLPSEKLSQIKGFFDMYIRSLYIPDNHDEIWVTTYSNGVFLLKNGKLTRFPLDKEQYLSSAHCIVEDSSGYFWITTNKGLFQIRRTDLLSYATKPFDLYYHYYSKIAGFNTNEFNGGCQPCGLKAYGGLISFPSINGLVWFVPERVRPELPNGEMFIDSPDIHDSSFVIDSGKILVKSGVPQIILKVSTPYFGEPYNLRISYRIFKGDEPLLEWQPLQENRSISVPFSGGGNYKLVVRKLGGFGVSNYSTMRLDISVSQRYYETWLFKAFVVTLVLLLFYVIMKQRLKLIKRQNVALEMKIRERTEHLEKTLSILSDSEKQLEQQVKLHIHVIASISHDIRAPVRHTSYVLEYGQRLIEEKKYDSAVTLLKQIRQAVDNMYNMIDNLVNFVKPEVRGVTNAVTQVNLGELINNKILLFEHIAAANNANINYEIAGGETILTDPKLLSIIIHNLIDNAIKIRYGSTLQIYIRRTPSDLHLIFEDNGPGLPAELIRWLNSSNSEEDSFLPAGYEGLGLLLLKQISKILHVDLNVTNRPGATIQLIFRGQ